MAQFWGRPEPVKRDLPAFWSITTHGQPFNDERLATGATNFYQILEPAGLTAPEHTPVGPATEQVRGGEMEGAGGVGGAGGSWRGQGGLGGGWAWPVAVSAVYHLTL